MSHEKRLSEGVEMGDSQNVFPEGVIAESLAQAGLDRAHLGVGHHPDSGHDCLRLEGTIQQYSAFLVNLVLRLRGEAASRAVALAETVQLQMDECADTRFWLPGVRIEQQP
ncbi:hypothetical protein [Streptomyces cucumeris]|uniref:hypothetical protein n=1 Tax=Streptomyces cucumeris TaxID=2962890 RepID=UPI0020C8F573|nr:hypothetical protein [Streptomyces sp. NEAU-Y11]MCP9209615.1 hypothetical protein [Streptomyces sp. NEAU-Y11]